MKKFSAKVTWFMPLAERSARPALPETFFSSREFLSCGRDALYRILSLENLKFPRSLWLPEFFCPHVVSALRGMCSLKLYKDYPSESSPRFDTISPRAGDAVVAVNFFGLRRRELWENWFAQNPGIVSIEDHSHAPFSRWAQNSKARYAFASLRKCLPLPDGAYLKAANIAPAKMFLSGGEIPPFSADMLAAAAAERSAGYEAAENFYYAGEGKLNAKKTVSRISRYSLSVLKALDIDALEARRLENISEFCAGLKKCSEFRELNSDGGAKPEKFESFAPALKFKNAKLRDAAHNALYAEGAMPSIYWGGLGKLVSADARAESDTTFVVPVDFRHTKADARRCAEIISASV